MGTKEERSAPPVSKERQGSVRVSMPTADASKVMSQAYYAKVDYGFIHQIKSKSLAGNNKGTANSGEKSIDSFLYWTLPNGRFGCMN